ncbi:uncharacterized protein BDZ99DRAFT_571834 [Mytilinidion resinicola]|uniref:Uncharacterized protein n=1 Tax=Mytilinidion resinicola TaxID=574789 RepID=A0A6A6YJK7_9PEZI|nr:uncharacterized protein BDZ99DRAFT_571834 [Mytilinidion resinicola]KAF2808991.1 hypothetical protein BDZ99DRAFT_571834 [Mytilinidion resinicola]
MWCNFRARVERRNGYEHHIGPTQRMIFTVLPGFLVGSWWGPGTIADPLFSAILFREKQATNSSSTITSPALSVSGSISSAAAAASTLTHGGPAHVGPQHPEAVKSAVFLPAPASTSVSPTFSLLSPSLGGINHPSGNTPVAPIAVHTESWLLPSSSSAPAAAPPALTPSAIPGVPSNLVQIDPAPVLSPSAGEGGGGGGGGNGGGGSVVTPVSVASTATPVQNLNAPSAPSAIPNHQQSNTAVPVAPGTPASVSVAGNKATGSTSVYVAPASGVPNSNLAPGETMVPQTSPISYGISGYTSIATALPAGVPYSASVGVHYSGSAGLPYSGTAVVTGSSATAVGYVSPTAHAPYPSVGNGTVTTSSSPFGSIGTLVTYSFSQHSKTRSSTGTVTSAVSTTSGLIESAKPTSTPNAAGLRFQVDASGVGVWAVMVGIAVVVVG